MEKIQITLASRKTLKVISQKKKSERQKTLDLFFSKEQSKKEPEKIKLEPKNSEKCISNAKFTKSEASMNIYSTQPRKKEVNYFHNILKF